MAKCHPEPLKQSRIHCAFTRSKLAGNLSDPAELATANVLLIELGAGDFDLMPQPSATCKSCGMCSAAAQPSVIADDQRATQATISLPMKTLLLLVLLLYGVPLAGLLSGALLAAMFGASDLVAVASAALCCVAAVRTMRRRAGRFEQKIIQSLSLQCEH